MSSLPVSGRSSASHIRLCTGQIHTHAPHVVMCAATQTVTSCPQQCWLQPHTLICLCEACVSYIVQEQDKENTDGLQGDREADSVA